MSAKHQYYYPCRDLTTPEEKLILRDLAAIMTSDENAEKFRNAVDAQYKSKYYKQNYFETWIDKSQSDKLASSWAGIDSPALEVNDLAKEYIGVIETIVSRYGGDNWRLMVSLNDEHCLPIHKDPKGGPIANCSIPITPDYAFYRPTNFYAEVDDESLVFQADYNKFKSPCLINMRKFHNAGNHTAERKLGIYNGKSVAIQVMYNKPYADVKKFFSSKGWLSTSEYRGEWGLT
jgi:hypothetical protein